MPSARLSKDDRKNLLVKLRDGHDLESAGAALELSEGEIGIAKDKYATEIATAFKTGTARLRARIMDTALSDDNAAILLKLLEQREKQTDNTDPITVIERVILEGHCVHCGAQPGISNPTLNTGDTHG